MVYVLHLRSVFFRVASDDDTTANAVVVIFDRGGVGGGSASTVLLIFANGRASNWGLSTSVLVCISTRDVRLFSVFVWSSYLLLTLDRIGFFSRFL